MMQAPPEAEVEAATPRTTTLRDAVAAYFSGQEWSLAFEVGNATGAGVSRHADAVAMNMWPSRGLSVHGIEMKISRGDWQRELAKPEKAEAIHRYCDFWWLAATRGVVKDIEEVPPGWGLLEMTEAGQLRVKRQAAKQERASDIPRSFVAGILRAHDRAESGEFQRAVNAAAEKRVEAAITHERASRQNQMTHAAQSLAKLIAALGEKKLEYLADEDICRAVAFVIKAGAVDTYGGILRLIDKFETAERNARWAADELRDAATQAGIEMPEPPDQADLPLGRPRR